jgi:ribosomal protein S18 acetylase RimI-like enzyme
MPSRPLTERDLDAVVAIDAALAGRSRRLYFERRLAAARREPERHLQLGVEARGALAGFMLGRALEGEFGRSEPALRLEAFGVARAAQGRGLGRALLGAFEAESQRRGLRELRTSARWREHALLGFFDRSGFGLAPLHVLAGAPAADFAPLARDEFEVRVLEQQDAEGIARIDRRITGSDRHGYLCRALAETIADSALRISLAARVEGALAGYLMARLDYGDFGRVEPVAVIDTIGVDPLRLRQGIGRALLSQLFMNLAALRVERVETVVAPGELGLLGLFVAAGLRPSERLSFLKRLP